MKTYLIYEQYYGADCDALCMEELNTIEDLIKFQSEFINESPKTQKRFNTNFDFISWDYANNNTKERKWYAYKIKKQIALKTGENYNGDWEYIPLISYNIEDDIINIWAEVNWSQKIFI